MGPEVVRIVLLPVVESYVTLIQPELDGTKDGSQRQAEAMRCQSALARAVGECLRDWNAGTGARTVALARGNSTFEGQVAQMRELYDAMLRVFGDKLSPYLNTPPAHV